MKKSLVILFAALFNFSTFAQKIIQEAHYKLGDQALAEAIQKKFTAETKTHDIQVCYISAIFARFTIDANGNATNIKFAENGDTPPVFRQILTEVINSTNGNWIPKTVNGKAVESKPFILPLIFQMEAGCYKSGKHVNNGTDNALIAFFYGDNGMGQSVSQLDCVLLKSLIAFSQN